MNPTQPPNSREIDATQTLRPAEIPDTIPAPPDSRVPIETAIRPRDVSKRSATAIPVAPRVPSDILALLEPPDEALPIQRSGT
jgi:hypothetical protein